MAYSTRSDIETRVGATEVAKLDVAGDGSTVAAAIEDADAEIDAALGKIYALPLQSPGPILTAISVDLARLRLWTRAPAKEVLDAARRSRARLASLASGRTTLVDAAGRRVDPIAAPVARRQGPQAGAVQSPEGTI